MAFLACHDGVVCDQRKSRYVMIEGCYVAPIVLAMASLAANAKLTVVRIVGAMAGHTCRRQLVAIEITGVARIAFDFCMGGPEREFRVLIVIKADRGPLVLLVPGCTLAALPSALGILNPVALPPRCSDSPVAFPNITPHPPP